MSYVQIYQVQIFLNLITYFQPYAQNAMSINMLILMFRKAQELDEQTPYERSKLNFHYNQKDQKTERKSVYNEIFKGSYDDYRKYNLASYLERESVRRKPMETRYNNDTSIHTTRVTQTPVATSSKAWTKAESTRQSERKEYGTDRKENYGEVVNTTPMKVSSKYDEESRYQNPKYKSYKGKR